MILDNARYHPADSESATVLLHGGNGGIDLPIMSKAFERAASAGNRVLGFDFPFKARGEKHASERFVEEVACVVAAYDFLTRARAIGDLHFVVKSMGSGVLSKALLDHPELIVDRVTILGAPVSFGILKPEAFDGVSVKVIQGEQDQFGTPADVKELFDRSGVDVIIKNISAARHSYEDYRAPLNPRRSHEDEALAAVDW